MTSPTPATSGPVRRLSPHDRHDRRRHHRHAERHQHLRPRSSARSGSPRSSTAAGYLGGTARQLHDRLRLRHASSSRLGRSPRRPGDRPRTARRARRCAVQELPPAPGLLSAGVRVGHPDVVAGGRRHHPGQRHATLTVTNPTIPIFGQVRVTKAITGATRASPPAPRSAITSTAHRLARRRPHPRRRRPRPPPPTCPSAPTCTITEDPPSRRADRRVLSPGVRRRAPQAVDGHRLRTGRRRHRSPTTSCGSLGPLAIAKAPIAPAGIVDPGRTFAIDYSCVLRQRRRRGRHASRCTAGGRRSTTRPCSSARRAR